MKKRLLAAVLALIMVLGILPETAWAEDAPTSGTCGENLTWTLKNGVLTISGSGEMKDYAYDNDNALVSPWFGNREAITRIEIQAGVTSIGNFAFLKCSKLTNITIPTSVFRIGNGAFHSCSALGNINIPNTVTSIGEGAFTYCSSLSSIIIPNSVTDIGSGAFYGSGLKSINIPDNVTNMAGRVFQQCTSLESASIGSGVTSIGSLMFEDCNQLATVTIGANTNSIANGVFHNCTNLTDITIVGEVTDIGDYAFWNCNNLTSITLPKSVTQIGERAFCECKSLTSICIPDGVTRIASNTFRGCNNLTSVTIPEGVTYIGEGAFRECHSLHNVVIPGSVTGMGPYVFLGCENIKSAGPIGGNYDCQFGWKDKIPASAFDNAHLTSVTIPDSITDIGGAAFHFCSLEDVIIGSGMTNIADGAFNDCTSLKDVYYAKDEGSWKNIMIGSSNAPLINATIHYNSTGPDQPGGPDTPTPPEDTESKLAFFGYWDAANKRMKPSTIAQAGGYTITDKTAISGAGSVEEFVNHYVMVDADKSSPGIWPEAARIRLLETRIGKVTSVEQTGTSGQYRFVIDGKTYVLSSGKHLIGVGTSLASVKEYFLNRNALCIFDGTELVRLDWLKFAAGTLKDSSSGIFKLDPLVTLETEMTTDVRDIQNFYAVCGDTASSIPAVGSAAGCYWNTDGVLVKVDKKTYQTKIGTLRSYESTSGRAVIDGVSIQVNAEEWEWNKYTERKPNCGDYVGKRVFYLLANNEIVHMDSLEKIEYQLTAIYPGAGIVVNRATYQNDSFDNSNTTIKNEPILATISYGQSSYPFLKFYNSEIVRAAVSTPPAITLKSAYWEAGEGFECKEPPVNNIVLNPGDKAERGFMVTIQSGFVPPYASKIVKNTLHIEGIRADGVPVSCEICYPVEVVNEDYKPSNPNDPSEGGSKLTEWEKGFLEELYKIENVNVTVNVSKYILSKYFNKSTIDDIDRAVTLWRAVQESGIASQMKSVPNELQIDCVMTEGRYKGHSATLIFHAKSVLDWNTAMFKGISVALTDNKTGATLVEREPYSAQVGASPQNFAKGIQGYLKAEYNKEFVGFCKKLGKDAIKASITDIATMTGNDYLNTMMDIYKNIDIIAKNAKEWCDYTGKASKIVKNPFEFAASYGEKIDKFATKNVQVHCPVNCPVNIYIYNPSGEVCGAVENNVITIDTTETFISVAGDEKNIWLNDNYSIKLVASEKGSMNYSICEYTGTDETRTVFFDNVPLATGITYEGDVPKKLGVPATDYSLKSNAGETIQADRDITSSIAYTVTFNANGGKVIPRTMDTDADRKLASLPTPTRDGYTFNGWYTRTSGGERVDKGYIFTSDTTLYARWTPLHGRVTISATFAEDDSSGTAYTIGGEMVTLRVYPDAGYRLSSIQVVGPNGQQVRLTQNGSTYTFAMPTFDVRVLPVFIKI